MKRLGRGEGTVMYGMEAVEHAANMAPSKLVVADTTLRTLKAGGWSSRTHA